MVTVINTFGVTKEEIQAVKIEAERLESMGYNVPAEIEIKFITGNAIGLAGKNRIYVHPVLDVELMKFIVRHEIGHHNEPEYTGFDIWSDKTPDQERQESEDFANDFAKRTA